MNFYLYYIPGALIYALIGTALGLWFKYKITYHVARYKEDQSHECCWCNDFDSVTFAQFLAGHSFLTWPLCLTYVIVFLPAYRYLLKPLFKYILIPGFKLLILRPISFFEKRYETASSAAQDAVARDLSVEKQLKELRAAQEADRKRHEKVDGAIARADAILKKAGDYSDLQ